MQNNCDIFKGLFCSRDVDRRKCYVRGRLLGAFACIELVTYLITNFHTVPFLEKVRIVFNISAAATTATSTTD